MENTIIEHTHYFACKDPPPNEEEKEESKEKKKTIKNLFGLIKHKTDVKEESKSTLEERISNNWSDYSSKPDTINNKKAYKLIKKVSNNLKIESS